ncbi:hypothetical protein Q7P37_008664 [Cladosporium fusiforme]
MPALLSHSKSRLTLGKTRSKEGTRCGKNGRERAQIRLRDQPRRKRDFLPFLTGNNLLCATGRQQKFKDFLQTWNHIAKVANMPSKLNKIQKLVTKKKGANSKALHENSRDALRIKKAAMRDDRVSRKHKIQKGANEGWLNRIAFFKEHLPDTLHPFDKAELQAAAEEYLTHMDEEIHQLQSERRAGRPASTRQQLLEQAKDGEKKEYESGLWMPNLQDEQTLIKLDAWQYDWLSLSNMNFIRLDPEGIIKEAHFPPNKAA